MQSREILFERFGKVDYKSEFMMKKESGFII